MQLAARKQKIARAEEGLDNALRKLALAATIVQRWRRKLKNQHNQLQKEMEAKIAATSHLHGERKVRKLGE